MAKFILALVCVIALQSAWALKCKKCKDAECTMLEDETCVSSSAPGTSVACLTFVVKENDKKTTSKRCVSPINGKYECQKRSTEELLACDTCTTDFCNEKSAAVSPQVGAMAAIAVVLTFVSKFL